MKGKILATSLAGLLIMMVTLVPATRNAAQVTGLDAAAVRAAAVTAGLTSLADIAVPQVNNLYDFINPGPGPKSMAVVLGKALFWDMQVGSDGQACASCHFSAGADPRSKNQWNPGLRASPPDTIFGNAAIPGIQGWSQFGPNYDVTRDDFPTHQIADPDTEDYNHRVILHSTNDVASSQGPFLANFTGSTPGQLTDNGTAVADAIFKVGDVNTRRVEPRNTPSVINAVFNVHNFLDGRAHNKFNGVNPLGPLDDTARILVNNNNVTSKVQVSIPNSSLASQAMAPPLSDLEMSFVGRTFPDIGKKMLAAKPLAFQNVHPDDSVLGQFAVTGAGATGLTFNTYSELVQTIFQSRYWDSTNVITLNPDGSQVINAPGFVPPAGVTAYTQMEANFSLFFGLAIQAYESTLISDKTRFDRFMEGDNSALEPDELLGLLIFINNGAQAANPVFAGVSQGACLECHKSALFSDATFAGRGVEGPIEVELAPVMVNGILTPGTELVLLDNGFYNIGVRPISEDLGRGASELGKPLSESRQAQQGFTFAPPLPAQAPQNARVMVDGAMKVPILRNVELTGPYFHNGGHRTLREVMSFYRRHGDFADMNIAHIDGPLAEIELRGVDADGRDLDTDRLVAFMLSLTDERVRNEVSPFDHPALSVAHGHPGDATSITQFDVVNGVKQAQDTILEIPAVGREGRQPTGFGVIKPFLNDRSIQSINIVLHQGWNLLSTPIRLDASTDTWGEFATYNGLNYQLAYRWDGAAFLPVAATDVLAPLDAIYVQMNGTTAVEIIPDEGVSGPPGKTLNVGWNLVGSAFLQAEMPVKDTLASAFFSPNAAPNSVNPLWGYSQVVSPTTNRFGWVYVRDAPVIPDMQVGEGYWVYMVNPGELSGFTTTPWWRR